ncbi:MAG: hypothetical protein ACLFQX_09580 [Candidatus Kapaibacterium sp.]
MAKNRAYYQSYFELAEHNLLQIAIFFGLTFSLAIMIFYFALPGIETFFENTLNGKVYNGGQVISYSLEQSEPKKFTNYYSSWAVDAFHKTPEETRYWFNPLLSFILPSTLVGLFLAVAISAVMPGWLGYIRQKIERELAAVLDSIAVKKYGYHAEEYIPEIVDELKNANLRQLHEFEELWGIPTEDLKVLHKCLRWIDAHLWYRILHVNQGLNMYLRFYFSVKYSNTMLGFVYIGAGVLIIIIGLRGLKFIPPTQPSLVIFALGLEFSLLITYAFTLMYTRQEEELLESKSHGDGESLLAPGGLGNMKEIEKLLKVFIKTTKRKD